MNIDEIKQRLNAYFTSDKVEVFDSRGTGDHFSVIVISEKFIKLNDKIKALNSTRVFKKITPKGDLSWYIKWVASLMLMIAVCFRAADFNHMFDLYFSFVGTLGWLWVGILWHDRALIMLNGALATLLFTGFILASRKTYMQVKKQKVSLVSNTSNNYTNE